MSQRPLPPEHQLGWGNSCGVWSGADVRTAQNKEIASRRATAAPCCISELEAHLHSFTDPDPEAVVFTGPKDALLRRAGFARLWWRPATQSVGLKGLKFHELRHTFVALWIAAGANPQEVSIRAGTLLSSIHSRSLWPSVRGSRRRHSVASRRAPDFSFSATTAGPEREQGSYEFASDQHF